MVWDNKKLSAVAILVSFLALACATTGQKQNMVEPQATFASLDKNQDKKISKDEYLQNWSDKKAGEENFKRLDADSDGFLTDADRKALMDKLDTDKDGFISLKEYLAKGEKVKEREDEYKRLDLNRDGVLSNDEFQARWPTITIFQW